VRNQKRCTRRAVKRGTSVNVIKMMGVEKPHDELSAAVAMMDDGD
jgi:hypothetical protein